MISLSKTLYTQICDHLVSCFPHEGCGVILGPCKKLHYDEIVACKNIQTPELAKRSYIIDPQDLIQIQKKCRAENKEIKIIFHSHTGSGAYFSKTDEKEALWEGKPLFPGVFYLVVNIESKKVGEAKMFGWDGQKFEETELQIVDCKF